MNFLHDVSHHACCMTFSALVDHLHFHLFFLPKCVTHFMCIFLNFLCIAYPPPLFMWVTVVPFVIWFLFFFYFYFVCLIMSRVFMCHVCMVFTPTTSITYYCFMICLLVCTSMLCNFFSILLLCSLVISAKKANFLEIKLWYPASCHQLLLNLLSTIVKVLHISYTFQLAVFLKKDY